MLCDPRSCSSVTVRHLDNLIALTNKELERTRWQRASNEKPIGRIVSLALLRTAIAAGRAHVAARDGGIPDDPRSSRMVLQAGQHGTVGGLSGCPRARESAGWMVRIFFWTSTRLTASRVWRPQGSTASRGGIQTLIKRLHQSGRRKSIDERRETAQNPRRVIDGRRLEVLHLPADVLEHSIVKKNRPNRPIDRREE